jgi:tryptophan-rich sensory protein
LSTAASTLAAETPTWRRITGVFGLAWIVLFAVGGIALQREPLAYDAPVNASPGPEGD